MNSNISHSNSVLSFSEKFENSQSEKTVSKDDLTQNNASFGQIDEMELRIINWLNKNNIAITIPEEKEFQYYEDCRKKAEITNSFKESLGFINDSPLLQRRRSSLPLNTIQGNLDIRKKFSSPKISKFRAKLDEKNEILKINLCYD